MSARPKRPYRKRKRAQSEEETRLRITEAAVELHGSVGPANTTVTQVAELAGVSRMTVYNHFPTDSDLFAACSSHWAHENPFPDPASWAMMPDPRQRLETALAELYDWYGRERGMLGNVIRDAAVVPALGDLMSGLWGGYMDAVVSVLSDGWADGDEDDAMLGAALRIAVDFNTWHLLNALGLDGEASTRLATRMVSGAASD